MRLGPAIAAIWILGCAGIALAQFHPLAPQPKYPGGGQFPAPYANPSSFPTAGGDVIGPVPANTIAALHGQSIASPTGLPGQMLGINSSATIAWTATPTSVATSTPFAVNGSPVPGTASPFSYLEAGAGGTPTWAPTPVPAYSQLSAGNGTYGNSSPYVANLPLSNETFPLSGKITHLSVQNVSGGSCTTAPVFNVYVIHGGVESDGTALSGSTTQESITSGPTSVAESLTFVAGDIVGTKIDTTSAPSSCNSVIYDVDALICAGPTC